MKGFCFPIMLGRYGKADKCGIIEKDKKFGEYSLLVCRLKKTQDYGTEVDVDNVKNVIAHIHFCKIEAARAFRDCVVKLVQTLEDESVFLTLEEAEATLRKEQA